MTHLPNNRNVLKSMIKILLSTSCALLLSKAGITQNCRPNPKGNREVPHVWMVNKILGGKFSDLRGRVVDGADGPVAGAVLAVFRLSDRSSTFIGSVETNWKGNYCFIRLPKGHYLLKVGASNFQEYDYDIEIVSKRYKWAKQKLDMTLDVGY